MLSFASADGISKPKYCHHLAVKSITLFLPNSVWSEPKPWMQQLGGNFFFRVEGCRRIRRGDERTHSHVRGKQLGDEQVHQKGTISSYEFKIDTKISLFCVNLRKGISKCENSWFRSMVSIRARNISRHDAAFLLSMGNIRSVQFM